MKVICNRGALLEALTVVGNVVNPRTPKPVLQCIKLTAADDRLTLAATDLEVAIRYSDAQVQIEKAGEALLPADKFRDIVRESMDDTLSVALANDRAVIKGHDSEFKIFTQAASEFPPVPDFEGEADFEIAGGHLKQLIGQTLFAAAKESTRYAFNGVLVVAKGKKISLVSTDGRRLAQANGDLASSGKLSKDGAKAIIPTKALQLVEKLIDDPEEAVGFQMRENQVIVHTSSATLTSNLVEGQFPPYEDVIPKDADKKMTASTADFLSAIKRAALLTTEESKGVRMQFGKSGLKLTSRSPEAGEAEVNFPCKFEGGDVEIGFNPNFLTDALRVVDTDEIALELSAANRPGLLRGGANFLYVIMPVNLQ
ncbi:MAG TPA: DNA polymerase III subunit beta [Tepidisphaeraceae bacterium]|jgi:DNA polymerase-3 subunit beta|nr:DNA polymerase III subunit beta [Tepidisphaeraceae bacterium]